MAKNLIIYYSRKGENYWNGSIKSIAKGNTEVVAQFIQSAVGGDLFEVDTVKPYAADYYACIEEAKQELNSQARPALKKYLDSIDGYDNIFVCGPCGGLCCRASTRSLSVSFLHGNILCVLLKNGAGGRFGLTGRRNFCILLFILLFKAITE